jgi:hypothetical protein
MSHHRRKKVLGILIFAIGAGILLALIVPVIGWVVFSAIVLICFGVYLLKC